MNFTPIAPSMPGTSSISVLLLTGPTASELHSEDRFAGTKLFSLPTMRAGAKGWGSAAAQWFPIRMPGEDCFPDPEDNCSPLQVSNPACCHFWRFTRLQTDRSEEHTSELQSHHDL